MNFENILMSISNADVFVFVIRVHCNIILRTLQLKDAGNGHQSIEKKVKLRHS